MGLIDDVNEITLAAYAKINLTLDILGKRDDGYHEVAMVMQSVGLSDTVNIQKAADGIGLSIEGADLLADASNLAHKAARLFCDEENITGGVKINLIKKIPIAAGLAGGSADAAAVLKGMNILFEKNLSAHELCRLGEKIGSDIPFCIKGGLWEATGRGEILTKLPPMPKIFVLLAKPPVAVSTAWAYTNYDAAPAKNHPDNARMKEAIAAGDWEKAAKFADNVLQSVTEKEYPVIGEYKRQMLEAGALAALMSGSGPTVFALFDDYEKAAKAAKTMGEICPEVFLTVTVNPGEVL